jgi:hypothetical protein
MKLCQLQSYQHRIKRHDSMPSNAMRHGTVSDYWIFYNPAESMTALKVITRKEIPQSQATFILLCVPITVCATFVFFLDANWNLKGVSRSSFQACGPVPPLSKEIHDLQVSTSGGLPVTQK